MKVLNKKAITIVELIVVITILAILGTISMLAFQGYAMNARDSVRAYDLNNIKSAIEYVKVEQWTYITPDNPEQITYSWSVLVRTQWVFWTGAKRKTKRLDKIPLDPLTQNEYTFSVTADSSEFELWAIMEWDDLAHATPSLINSTYASTSYRAFIRGTYNGKIAKASSWWLDYLFALPSIISTDLTTPTITDITTNNKLAINWKDNIPSSYNSPDNWVATPSERNFVNATEVVVFEWSFTDLKESDSEQINLIANLQDAYAETAIESISQLETLLEVDTTNTGSTQYLAQSLIKSTIDDKFQITAQNSGISNSVTNWNTPSIAVTCSDMNPWDTFDWEDWISYLVVEDGTWEYGIRNSSNIILIDPDWAWTNLCTSLVTDMSALFYNNATFNEDISLWDTSNVTAMHNMFLDANSFNQPLNDWDISNVVSINSMFNWASSFNQPLNDWNISWSSLINIQYMFSRASAFNQDISAWDTSNIVDMQGVFASASSFNQSLNSWEVWSVNIMNRMFDWATNFNQSLDSWEVDNVHNMSSMFKNARNFNQSLNSWQVSNVTNMEAMFWWAREFNQPLDLWQVNNVENMSRLFQDARKFNHSINSWTVSNVDNMYAMFENAEDFNQALNLWQVDDVTNMGYMFENTDLYNQNLSGWHTGNVVNCPGFYEDADSWSESNKPTFTNCTP